MLKFVAVTALALADLTACSSPPLATADAPKVEVLKVETPKLATPPPVPPAPMSPEMATAEANTLFTTRCAACHGVEGHGDGVAAQAFVPKPRDYGDKAWQASVTDEHIAKVIVEGGPSVGKSPNMTANADLKDKPEVVKALVARIRSIGK